MAQPKTSFYEGWVQNWWSIELAAVLLSCGLTGALCGILRTYDGNPVPAFGTWFGTGITLATIVSLLITVSVAASLSALQSCLSQLKWLWYNGHSRPLTDIDTFDSASRGLIGSLLLLWKLRLTPVASFGALLIAAHLAIAPLTQQSLRQELKLVPSDSEEATTAAVHSWLEGGQQTQVSAMPLGYTQLASGMMGAIANGLFTNAQTNINITGPQCTSGNCTFSDYNSLAICYSVANVSSSVKNERMSRDTDNGIGCIRDEFCLDSDSYSRVNITSAASSAGSAAGANSGEEPLNFSSVAFPDDPAIIGDFYVIYHDTQLLKGQKEQHNVYAAVEFTLSWCIQTFSTEVNNTIASTTRRPAANANFSLQGDSIKTTVDNVSYTIDILTHYTLQRYLWVLLTGSIWQTYDDLNEAVTLADSAEVVVIGSLFGATSNGSSDNSGTTQDYMNRLSHLLDNMATSMTNYVRSSGDPVRGTAHIMQSYVRVVWGFLAAPIAFTVCCGLFCLGVILRASFHGDRKPPVWKSSMMAGMRSLDPHLHTSLGGMAAQGTMTKSAENLLVNLNREGGGWRLVYAGEGTDVKEYVAIPGQTGESGDAAMPKPR